MIKAIRDGDQGYLVEIGTIVSDGERAWEENNGELRRLLKEFETLFVAPNQLPPSRIHDHAIRLPEGAQPPNLRLYRYPHSQKNEIAKVVKEMLVAGLIRPSVSRYSSPVLLIKEKDGGWRFCVDYRALNKITIPNKFPISTIDELLDELGGAMISSKLDLKSGYH